MKRQHSKDSLTGNSVVCIAGAHRSGTSMLARLLHSCGLYLGPDSDLVPGRADNPDGFWENRCFVALNDEVLNELGGAWDLPPKAEQSFNDRRLDPLRVKAQLLIEGFDSAGIWGWKDPRNCLTLPFWHDLLPELKVLVIVRNPLEVAYSLRNRNEDTSYSFGLRLWEIYNRRLIDTTKAEKRLVTQYDAFFKDAESELRRIALFAGLPDANVKSAAALVKRGRRHIHFTIDQLIDARASAEVVELYRALIAEAGQGGKALTRKRYESKIGKAPQIARASEPDLLPGSISRLNVSIPNSETVRREFDHVRRQAAAATQVLKVYADQGEGYSEALSLSVALMPDVWQTLKIQGVHRLHTNRTRRLRIDPTGPAFVSLSRIAVIREEDEAVLYSAECLADFAKLDLSAGLLKHEVGQQLLLLATDSDPQIYLPIIESLGEDPYRLEITLEVQSATRGAVHRQHKALREQSKLSAILEATRADIAALYSRDIAQLKSIESLEQQKHDLEAELYKSNNSVGSLEQYKRDLETEVYNSKKSMGSLEQQKCDLEAELCKSKNALTRAYDEATRLTTNQTSLQERLDEISRRIIAVRDALRPSKPAVRTLFDSIDREIRRIRRRSVLWKLGMALCRLFPKTHPARDLFPDRREMGRELKRTLQGIRRAVFSNNASTKTIALTLARLLELQRRVREVTVSLRFANRVRSCRRDDSTHSDISSLPEAIAGANSTLPSQANDNGPLFLAANRLAHVFDATWYLREHPELAAQGIDPLQHYIERGATEGCNPHPLFDTSWYLEQNPDLGSDVNPLQHYLEFGAREGRDPSPLFDSSWYLEQNPDLGSDVNPLRHYLECGALEGRDPHPLFDSAWYMRQDPPLKAGEVNPLQHFVLQGADEGRSPHPFFDCAWYLEQYPDVAGLNPLAHYVRWGCHGRSPHPLFDCAWYLEQYPDVASAGLDPLQHYLEFGAREDRDPSPLFDSSWYLEQNPDLGSDVNPLRHYLECGALEGRDPHPLFDTKWYLSQKPQLPEVGLTPLEHHVSRGAREGRSPHPGFDSKFDTKNHRESVVGDMTPLAHYLTVGWKLRYQPNPRFDPQFYLRAYPDVAAANIEPLTHFVLQGRKEGRKTTEETISFEAYRPAFDIPREPTVSADPPLAPTVKAIAFYLPQFHPIPENDQWWGEGFTDWTNVRRGSPNFKGHYQPHIPSALGYYDLRDASVLQRQAELAASYGIHGFCFYYYWFAGTVLLDLPLRQIIDTTDLDFPFCICWANENWTRRWDGKDQEILISQDHSTKDDVAFIQKIEPILLHKNYVRVEGKPLLIVYRVSLLPDPVATTTRWRNHFRECGHGELHLAMVRSFNDQTPPESYGFDAAVQFPAHSPCNAITSLIRDKSEFFTGTVFDYTELKKIALNQLEAPHNAKLYPAVMPSWDNTARRRESSTLWVNSCPESYYEWLSAVVAVASTKPVEERLVFINAWNEWAEGCHLEPDERFGYAWLNATSLALHELPPPSQRNDSWCVIPPAEQCIEVRRLPDTVRLTISVLFYHRDDLIPSFLQSLLPQIRSAKSRGDISCGLYLVFNYKVAPSVQADISNLINSVFPEGASAIHIRENGFNIGFGAGHNAIFKETESDLFLMLNSDVRIMTENWLEVLVDRFRESDAALIGLAESASKLREDGCGIPIERLGEQFDFLDGSVLAIRSELARRYGLFSDAFNYFYFEDADLCLRYRQMGLRLELLEVPCEHDRSSSSRLLPQYAVEGVLNRNRARFFERWGGYLQTRKLPNRLGLRFLDIDRQLQCASLPAVFGLLSDHPTATLDLFGLHEQLVPIFKHPRIRLIPFWKTFQKDDYLRCYEIEPNSAADQPLAVHVANTVGCVPDFEAARAHLNSIALDKVVPTFSKTALLYVARKEPLFDGRQPNPKCYVGTEEFLSRRGFQVQLCAELGTFETDKLPVGRVPYKHVATASSLELLCDIAQGELVISSDSWISELSQLLNKKTFLWLGATAAAHALWNLEQAGFFVDRTLSCLGCYHSFGRNNRNTCLRGDTACMRQESTDGFIAALERFLKGNPVTAAEIHTGRQSLGEERSLPSTHLTLDRWPPSAAASVLVLIPISPSMDQATAQRAEQLARRATEGMRGCRIVLDDTGAAPPRGCHPHRQSAMAALRQNMIERHLRDEKWIFWVDADVVAYPARVLEQLIARIDGGIAAPIVLMEGRLDEPANTAGFGPGRFYDIAGFVERGRWARFTQPYFDQIGPVYELDSVGSCYLVNADLYRWGGRHEIDLMSSNFVSTNLVWSEDTIRRNQETKANCFTEHYSICAFARSAGLPVRAFGDLIAYHQKS